MIEEFLVSKADGRCLYYLSSDYKHDPQLISGYLASLIVFMRFHQNRLPKSITFDKGIWLIEFDPTEEFFVAALIILDNRMDIDKSREAIIEILQSIVLITGSKNIPIIDDEEPIKEIIDSTIKSKLIEITHDKKIMNYQPGILAVNILN